MLMRPPLTSTRPKVCFDKSSKHVNKHNILHTHQFIRVAQNCFSLLFLYNKHTHSISDGCSTTQCVASQKHLSTNQLRLICLLYKKKYMIHDRYHNSNSLTQALANIDIGELICMVSQRG